MPPDLLPVSTLLNRLLQRSHWIRGYRVVLDEDVAECFRVPVGDLRRAVALHKNRFPPQAMIRLTPTECQGLNHQPSKFLPYGFTEEGILLVASILKTPQAVKVSIDVIRELFNFNSN
jgi:hypothetical protein